MHISERVIYLTRLHYWFISGSWELGGQNVMEPEPGAVRVVLASDYRLRYWLWLGRQKKIESDLQNK